MFERFTERARGVLADARLIAKEHRSPAIRRHHLLIALVDAAGDGSGSVAAVLEDAGADPSELRAKLVASLTASETALPEAPDTWPFTAEAKKSLELGLREALSLGHNYIGREHLLLGVLRDASGPLAATLEAANISHRRAREIVAEQSPPSIGRSGRRTRGREFRMKFPRRQTLGTQEVLRRAFERAGRDRGVNTGDLLVALLETPGTHFASALSGVTLDVPAIKAEVDRLSATAAADGTEGAIRVDDSGGAVTITDPRVAEAIKRLGGDKALTPEQLIEILRRLTD